MAFGGFGSKPATTGFGQPAAGTGFGGFSAPGAAGTSTGFSFGTPSSTAGTGFGGFGTPASTAATTGFSAFGAPTVSTGSTVFGSTGGTGFGFGSAAPATSANTGFGFGAPAASAGTTGFSFGAPAASTGTTGFSFAPPAVSSSGGFGFSGFGKPAVTSAATGFGSFGGFPTNTGTTGFGGGFGAAGQQQLQQQQPQPSQQQQSSLYAAILNVSIYGDERDAILTRWNQLQARWGVGKGYYTTTAPPLEFGPDNPFCLLKTVGYARLPTSKNENGLVALCFSKSEADLKSVQQQAVDTITRLLGSRPNLSVCVESVTAIAADKTELQIYVQERNQNGTVRRVPASDLYTHLQAPAQRQQLQPLALQDLHPVTGPTPEQLQLYLDNPPAGIDKLIWEQAKKDNPDQAKMVPIPMIGFQELHRKIQRQEDENGAQQRRLDLIAEDISSLQRTQATTAARINQLKRQHMELAHRLVKVLVRQEVQRKQGWSVQPDEEKLRVQLEAIQSELSRPAQFKGRLNELLSQIRLQSQQALGGSSGSSADRSSYQLEPAGLQEIRQLLRAEQLGLRQLVQLVQTDLSDLRVVQLNLQTSTRR